MDQFLDFHDPDFLLSFDSAVGDDNHLGESENPISNIYKDPFILTSASHLHSQKASKPLNKRPNSSLYDSDSDVDVEGGVNTDDDGQVENVMLAISEDSAASSPAHCEHGNNHQAIAKTTSFASLSQSVTVTYPDDLRDYACTGLTADAVFTPDSNSINPDMENLLERFEDECPSGYNSSDSTKVLEEERVQEIASKIKKNAKRPKSCILVTPPTPQGKKKQDKSSHQAVPMREAPVKPTGSLVKPIPTQPGISTQPNVSAQPKAAALAPSIPPGRVMDGISTLPTFSIQPTAFTPAPSIPPGRVMGGISTQPNVLALVRSGVLFKSKSSAQMSPAQSLLKPRSLLQSRSAPASPAHPASAPSVAPPRAVPPVAHLPMECMGVTETVGSAQASADLPPSPAVAGLPPISSSTSASSPCSPTSDDTTEPQGECSESYRQYYASIPDHDYCKNCPLPAVVVHIPEVEGYGDMDLEEEDEDDEITPYSQRFSRFESEKMQGEECLSKLPVYLTSGLPRGPPAPGRPSRAVANGEDTYSKLPPYRTDFSNSTKYDVDEPKRPPSPPRVKGQRPCKVLPGEEVAMRYTVEDPGCDRLPFGSSSIGSSLLSLDAGRSSLGASLRQKRNYRNRSRITKPSGSHSSGSCSRSPSPSLRHQSSLPCSPAGLPSFSLSSDSSSSRGHRRSYRSPSPHSTGRQWHHSRHSRPSPSYSPHRGRDTERRSPRRRSVSRSRSPLSPRRRLSPDRLHSRDGQRARRGERAEMAFKRKAIEERRIIYVGGITLSDTEEKLWERFHDFGDIEDISLHFRRDADNYAFVTFAHPEDASMAKERGNDCRYGRQFSLCYGGRRAFCQSDYADLDGAKVEKERLGLPNNLAGERDDSFDDILAKSLSRLKKDC